MQFLNCKNKKNKMFALAATFVFLIVCASCDKKTGSASGGAAQPPKGSEKAKELEKFLSEFKINKDSRDVVFTYVDDKGEFRSAEKIDDIPEECKNDVLITDLSKSPEERKSDSYAIVADLLQTDELGNFKLRAEPRADFERAIKLKRQYRLTRLDRGRGAGSPDDGPANAGAPKPPPDMAPLAPNKDKVIVYSASWCGYCRKLKALLKDMGISFIDKDVEKDQNAAYEMAMKLKAAGTNGSGVPVLDYMGTIVAGYSPEAVKKLYETKGKPAEKL